MHRTRLCRRSRSPREIYSASRSTQRLATLRRGIGTPRPQGRPREEEIAPGHRRTRREGLPAAAVAAACSTGMLPTTTARRSMGRSPSAIEHERVIQERTAFPVLEVFPSPLPVEVQWHLHKRELCAGRRRRHETASFTYTYVHPLSSFFHYMLLVRLQPWLQLQHAAHQDAAACTQQTCPARVL